MPTTTTGSTNVTALASSLLEPIPAHAVMGLQVRWAGDCRSEVSLQTPPRMVNVNGSLHTGGLVALVDAAGLAAIIGACQDDTQFECITALGAAASLEFHRPARGRPLATCSLDPGTQKALRPVLVGHKSHARITTSVDVVDERDTVVCRGRFTWNVRRTG